MILSRSRRTGFTLLEVLLASSLSILLMAALYVALDVQLRLAQEGRDVVEQTELVHAIVTRFEADISTGMGQVLPPSSSSTAANQNAAAGSATTTTTTVTTASTVTAITFQIGVIGDSEQCTIYIAKSSRPRNADESGEVPIAADARRITYWLGEGGLSRQELNWVTSEAVQNSTGAISEENKTLEDYVIADEVVNLQFEYWDGSGWQTSWDGSELGPDGVTPIGPPSAIRIRFWLRVEGDNGETTDKEFRHTVAISTASGPATTATDSNAANNAAAGSTP
jgi:type II secretory pathway component PulJ